MTPHLRIRASAGTGKTFRLTDRIIELLLLGADPAKIVALTFTRKSAGEFLNKTLRKLAECASRDAAAKAFCERRGIQPAKSAGEFLSVLRRVADALDRIEFGTLDSFFFRVVSAFSTELGLGGSLRLQDEISSQIDEVEVRRELARELDAAELVRELLRVPGRAKIDPLGTDFDLLAEIERFHTLYPGPETWGEPSQIWTSGCPWLAFKNARPVPPDDGHAQVAKAISEFVEFVPGSKLNVTAVRLLEKAGLLLADAPVTIPFGKKDITLSPGERAAARDALGLCLGRILQSSLSQSRRWHRIGEKLRGVRDRRMRSSLRFADLPVLVARLAGQDAEHLQFRLDGWFDHWLIDEFQDTSRIQWRALQPLVDEVLQDSGGVRSFFYVGDVKQSIYGFRDGDPTLFEEIFRHYTANDPDHLRDENLGESRRSAREVIDLVQRVFCPASLGALGIEPTVVARWQTAWTDHSAHASNPSPGHVLHIVGDPGGFWENIAEVIRASEILSRPPLSCAILVRKNDTAREAVRELAARGIPATTESRPRVALESPVGVAVLMASRLVADPSDAMARCSLTMGPLGEPGTAFVSEALEVFHLEGAAGMVTSWLRSLRATLSPEVLVGSRVEVLRRAAREFDAQGISRPRAFADFLEAYSSPASARPGTVQVMTVHKSKGLEFDLVFYPLLKDERMDKRDGSEIFCADERNLGEGTRPWVMAIPGEDFCAADPVLQAAGEALRERSTFDNLCNLYVAMTRARRALVVLTPE
jgi:ATP-dependent exoDNAse (exonuclease V) beta subunit